MGTNAGEASRLTMGNRLEGPRTEYKPGKEQKHYSNVRSK